MPVGASTALSVMITVRRQVFVDTMAVQVARSKITETQEVTWLDV